MGGSLAVIRGSLPERRQPLFVQETKGGGARQTDENRGYPAFFATMNTALPLPGCH